MRILLFFLPLFFTIQLWGQSLYFPPNTGNWETLDPVELNWCQERIDSLYAMLESADTKAFIILKNGRIVLEKYFDSFQEDSVWYWASAGKSLAAFIVGMAQEEGYLDIQDPVSDYLGAGWTSCTPEQEQAIKIWHQITMTTGLDERGVDLNCLDPSCLKYRTDPGTRWYYHNAPYRLVQDVVANATGRSFQQYTMQKLRTAIGFSGLWFNYVFYSTPRSMARFGLLMLAEGDWDGAVIMNDKEYLRAMTETSQPHNEAYGYLWWLNGKNSYQLPGLPVKLPGSILESAPSDLYAALGKNDQKLYVAPSKGMVVVRMGNKAGDIPLASLSSFDDVLWEYINALDCSITATKVSVRNNFSAYPNPFIEEIQTEGIPDGYTWELHSIDGRLIDRGILNGNIISVPGLASGLYLLRCLGPDRGIVHQQKLFRQ